MENAIRKQINSEAKFYFPNFEHLHWMYIRNVMLEKMRGEIQLFLQTGLGKFTEANEEGSDMRECDSLVWKAAQVMSKEMGQWVQKELKNGSGKDKMGYELDVETKRKMLVTFDRQLKIQLKIQENKDTPARLRVKRKSRDSADRDEEYCPVVMKKKYTKKPKKENSEEADTVNLEKVKKEEIDEEPIQVKSVAVVDMKMKINLQPTEEQSDIVKMFNKKHTSSGRQVKLNQNLADFAGSHLGIRNEDILKKEVRSFQEMDDELERCEALEAGEKVKSKLKPKEKEPKVKKEKAPGIKYF